MRFVIFGYDRTILSIHIPFFLCLASKRESKVCLQSDQKLFSTIVRESFNIDRGGGGGEVPNLVESCGAVATTEEKSILNVCP